MRAGRLAPGASLGLPSEMSDKKHPREEPSTGRAMFQHVWMDFASTSSKLISETDLFADLDIRDVDPDVESGHEGYGAGHC